MTEPPEPDLRAPDWATMPWQLGDGVAGSERVHAEEPRLAEKYVADPETVQLDDDGREFYDPAFSPTAGPSW